MLQIHHINPNTPIIVCPDCYKHGHTIPLLCSTWRFDDWLKVVQLPSTGLQVDITNRSGKTLFCPHCKFAITEVLE